jgi:hypothetical protein
LIQASKLLFRRAGCAARTEALFVVTLWQRTASSRDHRVYRHCFIAPSHTYHTSVRGLPLNPSLCLTLSYDSLQNVPFSVGIPVSRYSGHVHLTERPCRVLTLNLKQENNRPARPDIPDYRFNTSQAWLERRTPIPNFLLRHHRTWPNSYSRHGRHDSRLSHQVCRQTFNAKIEQLTTPITNSNTLATSYSATVPLLLIT